MCHLASAVPSQSLRLSPSTFPNVPCAHLDDHSCPTPKHSVKN
jgi:hypothetical protein